MKTILYFRVSTDRQGRSGLGLDAQRAAVQSFCASRQCETLGEYVEIESGKRNNRPELIKALHHAKVTGATIIIAKLDRLSRNLAFLSALQEAGTKFIAADMPEANELTVHIMAAVAQAEVKMISQRTKDALGALRAKGVKLGNPNGASALRRAQKGNASALETIKAKADAHALDIAPVITAIQDVGITSKTAIAKELNHRGIRTPRGGQWYAKSVTNLLERLSSKML